MGSGYSKMKKQARLMQEQFSQMQNDLQNKRVEGTAGGGLVKLTLNGEKELQTISIHPDCLTDAEGLQDLILAAFQNAAQKLDTDKPASLPFNLI